MGYKTVLLEVCLASVIAPRCLQRVFGDGGFVSQNAFVAGDPESMDGFSPVIYLLTALFHMRRSARIPTYPSRTDDVSDWGREKCAYLFLISPSFQARNRSSSLRRCATIEEDLGYRGETGSWMSSDSRENGGGAKTPNSDIDDSPPCLELLHHTRSASQDFGSSHAPLVDAALALTGKVCVGRIAASGVFSNDCLFLFFRRHQTLSPMETPVVLKLDLGHTP